MLFIALPLIGVYIGYTYAPEKVVEVDYSNDPVVAGFSPMLSVAEFNNSCITDADCRAVSVSRSDCDYEALNIESTELFQAEKRAYCRANPPEIMCDMVVDDPVCDAGVCRISATEL